MPSAGGRAARNALPRLRRPQGSPRRIPRPARPRNARQRRALGQSQKIRCGPANAKARCGCAPIRHARAWACGLAAAAREGPAARGDRAWPCRKRKPACPAASRAPRAAPPWPWRAVRVRAGQRELRWKPSLRDWSKRFRCLQHFGGVALDLHFVPYPGDLAVRAHQIGRADHAHVSAPVILLLGPDAKRVG